MNAPSHVSGYLLRRLLAIAALAFGITLLVFLIIRLIPGDPAVVMLGTNAGDPALIARLHAQLGLDKPIPQQYVIWLGRALHGDFGYSYGQDRIRRCSLIAAIIFRRPCS